MVFSGTIAEAIRFGRRASDEQVANAALLANADGFIQDLPDGYNTLLEERGSNLSGGQLQRIAIARAVLGNPAVLLLDEATSALDSISQAAVLSTLRQQRCTRILIAHQLSTVKEADLILVLEGGHLVQQGDYTSLENVDGAFRDLIKQQGS